MDNLNGKQIIQRYTDWLRDYSKTNCYNDVWMLELPFLNRIGNHIQIFVKKTEKGVLLSDYGETIGDLKFCGLDIDTDTRREMLNRLLRSFSVKLVGKDELQVFTSEEDLPDYMNELAQCMLAVDRMIYSTSPEKVARIAEEDSHATRDSKKKPLAATPT